LPGNADGDAIKIHRRDSAAAKSLGSDRQNSRAGPKVKSGEVGGKKFGNVGEKSQAGRRRGMLAGAKRHPGGNKDAVHPRMSFFPAAPGLPIGKDFQLSADRERTAGPCGVTCPDMLRKPGSTSSKSADEFSSLRPRTIRLDLEGIGAWPRYEYHVGGPKEPQAFSPRILPFLRAEAGPTVQACTRVRPLGFCRICRRA
jgi:hypothetical protein